MDNTASLGPVDYVVVALILSISLGIGVLFAVKDFRNTNRVEYLLGGRRMFMLPVALSVFATFTSGVSLIGVVADIYMYGLMAALGGLGMGISYLVAAFTIVPLLYPLKLTSIYEYLKLRFHSSAVRMIAVVIGMLQTLSYMSVALLSPALALQTAAGFPTWVSVGVVGFVGTVYTAIGGIKSVIWTDAFQSLVMLGGLLAIIFKGIAIVGGADTLWNIASAGDRAIFNDFTLDPRERNTWWGATIGFCFIWLGTICNQSSLLRISSMRSLKDAKTAFFINSGLVCVLSVLLVSMAWVVYACFVLIRCDPYQAGFVSNPNQIPPYFVMNAIKDMPGIAGVYIAMVFSASLSTLSSGISALASNTVEDLLKKPLKSLQENTTTLITKSCVFLYGMIIIGLAFGANTMKGPISEIFVIGVGGFGGPISGIFLLGALFPSANKYGALIGGAISITFNVWIAFGSQMNQSFEKPLQYPPTDMCFLNNSAHAFRNQSNSKLDSESETLFFSRLNNSGILKPDVEAGPRKFGFFLYDISYEWYAMIGVLNSLILGIITSYCTRKHCVSVTDVKLCFPFVRRFCSTRIPQDKPQKDDEVDYNTPMVISCNAKHDIDAGQLIKPRIIET